LRFSKLICKRARKCVHCEEEIEVGEPYINLSGTDRETEGDSGRLHVPCFIHWLQRLQPRQ